MKHLMTILLFCLFSPSISLAASQQTITNELEQRLGLAAQALEISEFARNEIDSRKEGLPEEEYKRLRDIIHKSFDEKRLLIVMKSHLAKNYDAKLSPLWLDTLKSEVFTKALQLEEKANQADSFPRLMAYAQSQRDNPAAPNRIALAKKLTDLTKDGDLAVESLVAVNRVLLHAINPNLPSNKQMSTKQIKTALDALRMQTTQTVYDFTAVSYLFTYQELSDEEFARYVGAYETAQGLWASKTLHHAVMEALEDAIAQFRKHF